MVLISCYSCLLTTDDYSFSFIIIDFSCLLVNPRTCTDTYLQQQGCQSIPSHHLAPKAGIHAGSYMKYFHPMAGYLRGIRGINYSPLPPAIADRQKLILGNELLEFVLLK